jgi:uncharacterized membrane protein YfcA
MLETIEVVLAHLPSLIETVAALAVVVLGGVVRGFTGFGAALIIVPSVALVYDPKTAVVLHALIEIPGILQLLPDGIRDCELKTVVPMLLGVIVALPPGMYFLVSIDAQIMRVVMSVSVLAMVGLLATGWKYKDTVGPGVAAMGGLIGGFIHGATGVGGPPIVTLLMSKDDEARRTRGNILIMMASLLIVAMPAQYLYGLFHARVVVLSAILAPVYVLSTYMGTVLFRRFGGRHFRRGAMVVLGLTALSTLVGSLL